MHQLYCLTLCLASVAAAGPGCRRRAWARLEALWAARRTACRPPASGAHLLQLCMHACCVR
jgi:hypothetical protein